MFSGNILLRSLIENKSVLQTEVFSLIEGVRNFFFMMVNKIIEKPLVKYIIGHNFSCLSLMNKAMDKENYDSKMKSIIACLLEYGLILEYDSKAIVVFQDFMKTQVF